MRGLLRVLGDAAAKSGVPVQTERGPQALQTGIVGFFEPWKVRWSLQRAKLSIAIAPGEFQWILSDARKERGPDAARLEAFQATLLEGSREWLRNGNR